MKTVKITIADHFSGKYETNVTLFYLKALGMERMITDETYFKVYL